MRALLVPLTAACALAWGVALAVGAVAGGPQERRAAVVATTTQAADLVRQVAGDDVRVRALVAANTDPHEHETRPGDVAAVRDAELLVRSGGEVDHWAHDVEDAAGGDAATLVLLDQVERDGEDPHWWQDPRNAIRAVRAIRDALSAAEPERAAAFARNARAYETRLAAADAAIARCWAAAPPQDRRLVTTHDAYGYYARRYGLEVTGSVLASLSSRAQPSARALSRLVGRLREEQVGAVFTESALNPGVERAVAREAGARVLTLQGDALAPGQTYLEALASDTRVMTGGLTGRPCEVPVG